MKNKDPSHRASSFRKTDVTRMIKAAIAAGIVNPVAEVDPVTKRLRVSGGPPPAPASDSDLDLELKDFEARRDDQKG
jgi:hypothetical protein